MEEIQLKLDEQGRGAFCILEGGEEWGKMEISVTSKMLTVYHTEVVPEAEGRGFAKKLLEAMVSHARNHGLKVLALCPFVQAQFKRNPEAYTDIIQTRQP